MNFGLFLVSAAILALEVLHVRILSVQMWYHHAYVVVTMAMLGFAVAGTVATLWRGRDASDDARRIAWSSTLFGVTVVVAHVLIASIASSETTALGFAILLVPYCFGGMVVTLALSASGRLHVRYFVNLLGSAAGAWVFIVMIAPLGAERLLVALAAIGPIGALFFLRGKWDRTAGIGAIVAVVSCAVMFVVKPAFLDIVINPEKRQHLKGEIVDQRWTPLTRLDLFAEPDNDDVIHIVQDGAAGTIMYSEDGFQAFPPLDSHACAYLPHLRRMAEGEDGPTVAVIGIGGGTDIRTAVQFGATRVLGLEINEEMAKVAGEDYAEFNGGLFQLPGVEVVVGEGRSTLERLGEPFDVIILAGADTYTAGAYGAFVLSESYLYTDEALGVYLDHLKPGGTAGILRFYDEPHRETLRLLGMVLLEMRRRGAEQPSRHVAILRSFWSSGTVFSNEPFSDADIELFGMADDLPYDADLNEVIYLPGRDSDDAFARLARAVDDGSEEEFYAAYRAEHGVDVRPVTDDSPFFFNFHHMWQMEKYEDSAFARTFDTTSPIAPSILRDLLLQIAVLVGLLVLAPLAVAKRGSLRRPHAFRQLVFFLSIGAAFMFLEISTAQRLVLFLGHPTYSLTVVLFSFLFFAGLGALFSERFADRPTGALRKAGIVLCAMIAVFAVVLPILLPALLPWELHWRIGIAIVILAPLNFVMGMPFPLALGRLKRLDSKLVPWAIGANGGAGVIGSVLAVGLAMESGFTLVAIASFAAYLLGILIVTTGPLSTDAILAEES